MKIYDCTTFYSEKMMLDLRFNILNNKVYKFIIVESSFSHSGEKKNFNFNINNYPKFKDKIIYLKIDKEPTNLYSDIEILKNPIYKRLNSIKRIEQSYDYMMKGILEAQDEDLIIISDNDEIPNLDSNNFKKSNKNFFIFKQLLFYYKFNLFYELMPWFGSKACKKKYLKSFSNLKNLKNKKYPFWRLDTYFSNIKETNIDIIDDGGWHFTNIKTPEELYTKMKNFGHHNEFDESNLTVDDLREKISQGLVFYDHFADKNSKEKWKNDYKLKVIENDLLPNYLIKNQNDFKEWFK
jgi:beta-1,4-mannosyl-glycoprotein beta-1,4-N-acetylglucosaminyltransferase